MRYAFCNETYGNLGLADVCADIADAGYDAVEIAPFTIADDPRRITLDDARTVGRIAANHGLAVAGLHWLLVKPTGMHLTTPDAEVRRATAEFGSHLARLCAAMGGSVMVWGSPNQRTVPDTQPCDEAFDHAVGVLRTVCDVAGPLGVKLAFEPLGPAETNFINTAAEAVKLIEAVDRPAMALHLDVKAMSTEPEPIDHIIRACRRWTAHFHANDPNRRGPGTGAVRFEPIADALRQTGYAGYVSVEVFDYEGGAPKIARDSIAYLRKVFNDPGR